MKATWCRDNEYSALYESAEWQDRLAGPRSLVNGALLGLLMVFAAWAIAKFARYF